jgi:uncharacterized protein (UPF0332 family)
MTGIEFISLAIKLSNSSVEAELRTSVSRAYYGAFHTAKEFLEECGVTLPRGANPHDKVYFCFDNCADGDARLAGSNLNSLRASRNDADYDLETDQFTSRRNVQRFLRNAHEIVDAISSSRQKLSTIRNDLRDQARRLGLTVLGED